MKKNSYIYKISVIAGFVEKNMTCLETTEA